MDETGVSNLKGSSRKVGKLYPVLLDRHGNIIDGKHRLAADSDWPKIRLDHIASEKERVLARLVGNMCRRTISNSEKREMLKKLGGIYLEQGEKPGKLAYRIAEETGMSYRWVMKYLPERMKARPGLGGPSASSVGFDKCKGDYNISKVAQRATIDLTKLLTRSQEKPIVIKTYTNASFVSLTLEKRVYEDFERFAKQLGLTAETIISNAMLMVLREVESMISSMPSTRAR
ncbi:MAG TPA: hypothetical protein VMW36_10470 [Patescibacteria group bacterium]|nr:hypothetical protein [Patescibacteria group bacterium]